MTGIRGSSNDKARRELDWRPSRESWRDGFKELRSGDRADRASFREEAT
jgi:hypothetical protein